MYIYKSKQSETPNPAFKQYGTLIRDARHKHSKENFHYSKCVL